MNYYQFRKKYLAVIAIGNLIETLTELHYHDQELITRLIKEAEKILLQFNGDIFHDLHWEKNPEPVEKAYQSYLNYKP